MATKPGNILTIFGCGFMGTALLSGILKTTPPEQSKVQKYVAAVKSLSSVQRLEAAFSEHSAYVHVVGNDGVKAISAADVVLLGFQPGDTERILEDPQISEALQKKLIISMVAGVSCAKISRYLQTSSGTANPQYRIVRVVPSIGAQINESASLLSESTLSKTDVDFVKWLFERVGTVQTVPEHLIDASVALSASCHALVVTAMESVVDGAVSRGLSRKQALAIASQCFRGASTLLQEKMTVEELKDSMSVPRGITTEAWVHLEAGNVRNALTQTVRHAVDYAENMA